MLLDHSTISPVSLGRPSLPTALQLPTQEMCHLQPLESQDGSAHALAFGICDLCPGQEACHCEHSLAKIPQLRADRVSQPAECNLKLTNASSSAVLLRLQCCVPLNPLKHGEGVWDAMGQLL